MTVGDIFRSMSTTAAHNQTRILVQAAAAACENKKGEDTRILELDPVDSGLADFFTSPPPQTTARPSPSPTRSRAASSANSA